MDTLKTIPSISFSAYADDLVVYTSQESNLANTKTLQRSINKISKIGFAVDKCKSIHICKKRTCYQLPNKISIKLLGLILQKNYKFDIQIETLNDKLKKDFQVMKVLLSKKYGLKQDLMKNIIEALSVSKIRYCIEIYGQAPVTVHNKINVTLNKMKRLMLGSFASTPLPTLHIQSGIPQFKDNIS